jgi:hypothetical protein
VTQDDVQRTDIRLVLWVCLEVSVHAVRDRARAGGKPAGEVRGVLEGWEGLDYAMNRYYWSGLVDSCRQTCIRRAGDWRAYLQDCPIDFYEPAGLGLEFRTGCHVDGEAGEFGPSKVVLTNWAPGAEAPSTSSVEAIRRLLNNGPSYDYLHFRVGVKGRGEVIEGSRFW